MTQKTTDRSELDELDKKLETIRKLMSDAHTQGGVALSFYEELAREEVEVLKQIREKSKSITFHMD